MMSPSPTKPWLRHQWRRLPLLRLLTVQILTLPLLQLSLLSPAQMMTMPLLQSSLLMLKQNPNHLAAGAAELAFAKRGQPDGVADVADQLQRLCITAERAPNE
mmetsp:Transcript_132587/g.247968  ORF Transcript_132587/g.247968 Transcript_132587/m.247968 type:complete len:103 (-) Transcript_132587:37-345(-)